MGPLPIGSWFILLNCVIYGFTSRMDRVAVRFPFHMAIMGSHRARVWMIARQFHVAIMRGRDVNLAVFRRHFARQDRISVAIRALHRYST